MSVLHFKPPRPRSPPCKHGPVVVIDTREQTPLPIEGLPWVRGSLQSGDYSIQGAEELFAIERKTIPDLVSCCSGDNRTRFEKELHRLRGFAFARLLVIGTQEQIAAADYPGTISPQSVLASLAAWEIRYRVPVIFTPTLLDAVAYVEAEALWFAREHIKTAQAITNPNL